MQDEDSPHSSPEGGDRSDRVADLAVREPGEDDDEPYENVDVSSLPDWWRAAIEEHRRYDLRPYRPPVFADGVLKHRVVRELEDELEAQIRLLNTDVEEDRWEIRIDETVIGHVLRTRDPDGYSVYELDSDEFRTLVREAKEERNR